MDPAFRALGLGVGLLVGALALDLAGSSLGSLPVLVLSFALAVAGAVVALRGVIELVGERAG
ncbi:MAG: hypothetical protein JRM86_06075 [Nitrososphaerota archaeon]|nr:hypothetical protein [Nitrososphaerota archaeon]MDG7021740.1 hypothetical protein [Nitrososphaerota archaeon]MDG7022147.1 hypothetical protein [Nitrososphaerota archaeon]